MTSADDNNNDNTLPPEDGSTQPTPPVMESNDTTTPPASEHQYDEAALEDPDAAELNRQGSALGGGSSKTIIFITILVVATAGIIYYLFSDSAPPPPSAAAGAVVPTKPSTESIAQPAVGAPPSIGAPASITAVTPPAPPPPPPPPPAPPSPINNAAGTGGVAALPPKPLAPLAPPEIKAIAPTATPTTVIDKRSADRMRSNMLLLKGGSSTNTEKEKAKDAINKNDPNAEFASNAIEASAAEDAVATKMTNLNRMIAQGKIIDAIIETAVNSDLPGTLRAIISRDVYAESGREILIPKGSRLIGTYNTGILRGQKRLMIVWTRVITPTGVDIEIGSPGIDALGRAGIEGTVDNKYMEAFSGALLTSMVTVGIAIAADGNISGNSTSITNTDGSSTSSGSAGANAINGMVTSIGNVATKVVGDMLDLRPTITLDQGTRLNVFVNKDLKFPGPDSTGSMFIQ